MVPFDCDKNNEILNCFYFSVLESTWTLVVTIVVRTSHYRTVSMANLIQKTLPVTKTKTSTITHKVISSKRLSNIQNKQKNLAIACVLDLIHHRWYPDIPHPVDHLYYSLRLTYAEITVMSPTSI